MPCAQEPYLEELCRHDSSYQSVRDKFINNWNGSKGCQILGIYSVVHAGWKAANYANSFEEHRRQVSNRVGGGVVQTLFHGTQRACHIGCDDDNIQPCNNSCCHLCSILKSSFKLSHVGTNNRQPMFGRGIYTTSSSSKASQYAGNHYQNCRHHAMLVCNVVTGNKEPLYKASHGHAAPSFGYDSVQGMTKPSGSLEYPETVVYREDAILPVFVVMFDFT